MNKKKKILHLTQAMGGIKTYIGQILTYADFALFDYVVVIPKEAEFIKFCTEKNIKYHLVNSKRNINFGDILVFIKIINILLHEKPDIIHCHSAKGGFLGRVCNKLLFTKAKIIYTPNAFSHLSFTGVKRMVFYFLEYTAKRWTNLLLAVSYSEANRAIFEFNYKPAKVKVILNSVIVGDKLEKSYGDVFRINTISRLSHQKNPMLFLEIAKVIIGKYHMIEFNILGAGILDTLRKDIDEFIKINDLGNYIKIHEWGDQELSEDILLKTDIFLMTSSFEGLPFSLLEAMAKGIPCIVTKVDGNTDVIQNQENGFACLSVAEFVEKIELLINSEELRRNIGMAGFDYVKEFHNSTINVHRLNCLYEKL